LQIAGQLGADDAGGGFGVGDDSGQLTGAERRRGHDRNRADALDGQPRRDEPGIVRESKDDAIACADAEMAKSTADARDTPGEVCVGEAAICRHDGGVTRPRREMAID
jgi:hypothetical protein